MNLAESLIADAEAQLHSALPLQPMPQLGLTPATEVEVEVVGSGSVGADEPLDEETLEALGRSKALEFSRDELTQLRTLSFAAMVDILTRGAAKEKVAAAKLQVLLAKVERDTYLELRKQAREGARSRRASVLRFPNGAYLASIAEDAGGQR